MSQAIKFTTGLILFWIIGYLLVVGRSLFVPLVVAIFIWYLLNTFTQVFQKIPKIGPKMPYWVRMMLSLLSVMVLVVMLINIVENNVTEVVAASSRYKANLNHMLAGIHQQILIKAFTLIDDFLNGLSTQNIITNLYSVFSSLMSSAVLITLYVIFLFVEQLFFKQKIRALFPNPEHRRLMDSIISQIVNDTQTYLGLKTILGLIGAFVCWFIMHRVGLDFAEFWALLIFLLSYIPNIGPILAAVCPALLAIIQFQSWWPFIFVTSGIAVVQFVIGNLIEPRFLGKSLNLSPLVILFVLGLWGTIWGLLGMFLAVPITVVLMIIFTHFPTTRPLAVILSQDGQIRTEL